MWASDTWKMSTSSRSAKASKSSSGPSKTGLVTGRRGPAIAGSIRSVSLPHVCCVAISSGRVAVPTRGQRVRGRAGGGGDDDAVGVDQAHALTAHLDLDAQHARILCAVHHDLVESHVPCHSPRPSEQLDLQDRAFLDPVLALDETF